MAKRVVGARLYHDKYDISCDTANLKFSLSQAAVNDTTICHDSVSKIGGLKSAALEYSGFWEAGTNLIDATEYAALGTSDNIMTILPAGLSANGIAYVMQGAKVAYEWGGSVGDMIGFSAGALSEGDETLRGNVLASGAKTSSENGLAYENGAVSATQSLYGVLILTAVDGSGTQTLNVKIQSDALGTFTDPTDQIAFTQQSVPTAIEWATPVAGPITDTFWRAVVTVALGGASVSFSVVVMMAIV